MSKPIKNLITASYKKRFEPLDGALLIDVRGVKSNQNNTLRAGLKKKNIRVTVVKNSLAKSALAGTRLEAIIKLFEGPSALVYGGESVVGVARELIEATKELEAVKFKGAVMDGQLFGPDQLKELSKYPTKGEAQSQVVTLIFSPGRKIAGQIVAPGRKLASQVKTLIEKKEKEAPPAAATPAVAPSEPGASSPGATGAAPAAAATSVAKA
jgi:large subunit ribosomal protein L10